MTRTCEENAPGGETLYVRDATTDDVPTLLEWRARTAAWIRAAHGSTQWSQPLDKDVLRARIAHRWTVMAALSPGGDPVATSTLTPDGDPRLWTARERRGAAYMRKSNVDPDHRGRGTGSLLRSWMVACAARAGARVVRGEIWADNPALLAYHLGQGWTHLRTVTGPDRMALIEIPAAFRDDLPVVAEGDVFLASGRLLQTPPRRGTPR